MCSEYNMPVPNTIETNGLRNRRAARCSHEQNAYMAGCRCVNDDHRVITGRPITVGAAAAEEASMLRPLPGGRARASTFSFKADHKSQVCVRQFYLLGPGPLCRGRRVSGPAVSEGSLM